MGSKVKIGQKFVSHLIYYVFWGADFDLRVNFNVGVKGVKIQWGQRSNFLVITLDNIDIVSV